MKKLLILLTAFVGCSDQRRAVPLKLQSVKIHEWTSEERNYIRKIDDQEGKPRMKPISVIGNNPLAPHFAIVFEDGVVCDQGKY